MGSATSVESGTSFSIEVVESYDKLSALAADNVSEFLAAHPTAAFTLPTGETPVGMYRELVRRADAGEIDFSRAQFFCLDDYLGATPEDEASLTRWLTDIFLVPAHLPQENIHYIPSTAEDPTAAAAAYDRAIADLGGFQLAVVGLGPNGHVGFNEPGSRPDDPTRVVDLQPATRAQSAAYWEGRAEIPAKAMTTGLATILAAKKIVLIVSGKGKAEIVRASLEGPETADVPGSWLRRAGDRLHVILDKDAASLLSL
ncbi:MAG TPA: glucosamine-6-phosphate deaminase [Thermomicrobiales bacterium]|nr:glucosamine-6-phosphate deaminase [Thermomicrobiales bacterium]